MITASCLLISNLCLPSRVCASVLKLTTQTLPTFSSNNCKFCKGFLVFKGKLNKHHCYTTISTLNCCFVVNNQHNASVHCVYNTVLCNHSSLPTPPLHPPTVVIISGKSGSVWEMAYHLWIIETHSISYKCIAAAKGEICLLFTYSFITSVCSFVCFNWKIMFHVPLNISNEWICSCTAVQLFKISVNGHRRLLKINLWRGNCWPEISKQKKKAVTTKYCIWKYFPPGPGQTESWKENVAKLQISSYQSVVILLENNIQHLEAHNDHIASKSHTRSLQKAYYGRNLLTHQFSDRKPNFLKVPQNMAVSAGSRKWWSN